MTRKCKRPELQPLGLHCQAAESAYPAQNEKRLKNRKKKKNTKNSNNIISRQNKQKVKQTSRSDSHTALATCKQGWQYGTVRKYGTSQFLLRSTERWYGTFFFCHGSGTIRWYGTPFLLRYGYGTLVLCLNEKPQTFCTLSRLFVCRGKRQQKTTLNA